MSDKLLTTRELIEYIKQFHFTSKKKQFHLHHTFIPNHTSFNGRNHLKIQDNMRRYHVNNKHWSDIGQNLSLFPDGKWVTGRDFNRNPASIAGWNKNAFAVEMIGNFDIGKDKLEGEQLNSIIEFIAFFIEFFDLTFDDFKYHRDHPNVRKSCPGTSLNKEWMIDLIKKEMNKKMVEKKQIKLNILGNETEIEGVFSEGRNYVGVRELLEKLGYTINWNQGSQMINVSFKLK